MNVLQEGTHNYVPFHRAASWALIIIGVLVFAFIGAFVTVSALWDWLT